jgi:photosystem II stability/assembly factor-like uncharacterized protein
MIMRAALFLLLFLPFSLSRAQGWFIQNVGTTLDLNALYYQNYQRWIPCNQGLLLRSTDDGTTWNQIQTPTNENLNDISWPSALLVVGNNGVILRSTNQGSNWTQVNSNTTNNLYSIYFNIAVGANGTILKGLSQGTNWQQMSSPTSAALYDNSNSLIVGAGGTILKYNGQLWQLVNSGTTNDLLFVIEGSASYAIGKNGTIIKSTDWGSSWFSIASGTTADLHSMTFYSTIYGYRVMYVCGAGGLVRKSTDYGTSWITSSTGVNVTLKRITAFYPRKITAIGTGGMMINNSSEYSWLFADTLSGNTIRTPFLSDGSCNNDMTWSSGFEWPAGSNMHARFESGIFLGARVGSDTLVAIGYYDGEFAPGKTVNGLPVGYYDPVYRIYKLRYQFNDSNRQQWPNALLGNSDQGAPVYFDTAAQTWKPLDLGHQTMFHSYTDSYAELHSNFTGETAPLKGDVRQVNFAIDSWNGIGRTIFQQYTIINKSSSVWNDFYIGWYSDDDLGDAQDDLVGVDSALGMAYTYNSSNYDQVYGAAPPAVGVVALRGPLLFTGNNSDTAVFCKYRERVRLPRYREVKFNVMRWLAKAEFTTWREPSHFREAYNVLKGLLINGQQFYHPSGYPTTFSHTGDPVTGTGWLLTGPADHRLMISVGPLNMNPGDTQTVVIAQVIARGSSNLNSITLLRETALEAINYYNSCYDPFPIAIEPSSSEMPQHFALYQNFPNPFNAVTAIKYQVPKTALVSLKIYDVLGSEVQEIKNEIHKPGFYKVDWDGTNFSSGVYFCVMSAGEYSQTIKILLLK